MYLSLGLQDLTSKSQEKLTRNDASYYPTKIVGEPAYGKHVRTKIFTTKVEERSLYAL